MPNTAYNMRSVTVQCMPVYKDMNSFEIVSIFYEYKSLLFEYESILFHGYFSYKFSQIYPIEY